VALQVGDDPNSWTTDQLVNKILGNQTLAEPGWYEVLGQRKNERALKFLTTQLTRVADPDQHRACAQAFRHFKASPLEADAIEALRASIAPETLPDLARVRATALVTMGGGAYQALRQILAEIHDSNTKSIAIGGLVTALRVQGGLPAMRLLLAHYRPPLSGPHELGVRTLSSFRGEDELKELGKALLAEHGPRVQRVMVAGALGRSKSAGAEAYLIDGLKTRQASVRCACVVALGQLGATKHERLIRRLAKDEDPRVRNAVFQEQLRLTTDPAGRLEKLKMGLDDRDWAVRLAALEVLTRLPGSVAFDIVAQSLVDPDPHVRRAAIKANLAWRRRESIPVLISLLERDSQRLTLQAADALQLLTGLDLGEGPARWRQWWEKEGHAKALPSLVEAKRARDDRQARRTSSKTQVGFYGIPLISNRVCFVLDQSGSMMALTGETSATTRLDAVKGELMRSLDYIPDGARFNMIFFSSGHDTFKKRLTVMNDHTRKDAKRFVARKTAGGGTAIYDAIMLALEDPDVDTIVVLSDGQPAGGTIDDPFEIIENVREATELSEVVFHAVSFHAPGKLLEQLTQVTGGMYREVK
jgi:HEAT repeat protein/Mg-chelatase subunit ChlD